MNIHKLVHMLIAKLGGKSLAILGAALIIVLWGGLNVRTLTEPKPGEQARAPQTSTRPEHYGIYITLRNGSVEELNKITPGDGRDGLDLHLKKLDLPRDPTIVFFTALAAEASTAIRCARVKDPKNLVSGGEVKIDLKVIPDKKETGLFYLQPVRALEPGLYFLQVPTGPGIMGYAWGGCAFEIK